MPPELSAAPRPPAPAAPPAPPTVRDPLPGARPFALTGWAERQRFSPLLAAALVFVSGFVAYQLVGTVLAAALLVIQVQGSGEVLDPAGLMGLLAEHPATVFGSNAVGQVAGFFVLVLLATRLHTPEPAPFLRLRRPDGVQLALAGGGLFALLPFVSWIGEVNLRVPLPEGLMEWEAQQAALLEQILGGELNVVLALLFVAVTPAICEELMFRGYLQRQVERRLGVVWSIVLIGLLFGLFHLRFTQALPLTVLGLYLGFVVWVTGSLWSGVLVHLLNNGFAVIASDVARRHPDLDPVALEEVSAPWYLALLSLLVGLAACQVLLRRRGALLGAAVASPPSPPASHLDR
ncbi:MAG: CPBP family intramembrane glutamic endopeptidase [Rhodothermales bacterium]|nr:CPBP family intramembrane glutamic endopeptidase [Rhodothermales bacterium]